MTLVSRPAQKIKKEKKKKTMLEEIGSFVLDVMVLFIAFMLLRTFVAEAVVVKGTSMTNTLQNKEVVLVSKMAYGKGAEGMQRGDIVICHYPGRTEAKWHLGANLTLTHHTVFVKRLVALPGDTVEITGGTLYVNGEAVPDPEKMASTPGDYPLRLLGENEYFVVGDNRRTSHDSRASDVGPISREMIMGKATRVIFPFSGWRALE